MSHSNHKIVSQKEQISGKKIPNIIENPKSYLTKNPVWAFSRVDKDHSKWSISKCECLYDKIICKLISFEGMTWQDIQAQSGGRSNGTNSHFINISEFCKEAQDRAKEIIYDDTSQMFSLRLSGKERVFGVLGDGILYIVWYDKNHEICPSLK